MQSLEELLADAGTRRERLLTADCFANKALSLREEDAKLLIAACRFAAQQCKERADDLRILAESICAILEIDPLFRPSAAQRILMHWEEGPSPVTLDVLHESTARLAKQLQWGADNIAL